MTYEEAIEFTKKNVEIYCKDCLYQDDCSRTDNCRCTEWEKMVVGALERQTLKKPKNIKGKTLLYCPRCANPLTGHDYCGDCGQAIDWSDDE